MNDMTIKVRSDGVTSETVPSPSPFDNPTNINNSTEIQSGGFKAAAAGAIAYKSAKSIGLAYVDAKFSVDANGVTANKFRAAQKVAGYGSALAIGAAAGGPVGAGVAAIYIGVDIATTQISYNSSITKQNINASYNAQKFLVADSFGGFRNG